MQSRFRLSPAMIVAWCALFVALAGTAAATVIVSANGQVAKNTISGHKPPRGDHSNIIAGSVTSADVAQNSLTGSVINESTLAQVPSAANAAELGGSPASAFQQRISGACTGGTSIASVSSDGTVGCTNQVFPINLDSPSSSFKSTTIGDFQVELICENAASSLEFSSSANNWTFDYLYATGTNSNEGVTSGSPSGLLLDFTNTQFQGHFIVWDANQELTVDMVAVDTGSGCQGRGTAQLALN